LYNLAGDLLRLASELHPSQLGQQQLQMRDLLLAREQLLIFELSLCVLRQDDGLQPVLIQVVQIR